MQQLRVSRKLSREQLVYRCLSFYELMDMLTFSQLGLPYLDEQQRTRVLNAAAWRAAHLPKGAGRGRARGAQTQEAPSAPPSEAESVRPFAWQSWRLDAESSLDAWRRAYGNHAQGVCLVSSVEALGTAIFPAAGTSLCLLHARELDGSSAEPGAHLVASAGPELAAYREGLSQLRLRVDVGGLLQALLVPVDASPRFLDLVAKVVQDRVWVPVERMLPLRDPWGLARARSGRAADAADRAAPWQTPLLAG